MQKPCFADRGRCTALELAKCKGKYCSFRKTSEQLAQDTQKALRRISGLNISQQRHISDKYYGGNLPHIV